MSNENQGMEYIKVVADILEQELGIAPAPGDTNPNDHRVLIYNQNMDLPTYEYMFVILSEGPGKIMANINYYDGSSSNEIHEIVVQRPIMIDVMSRTTAAGYNEARNRKEEILMALNSTYAQQQMGANGFRIFSYPTDFLDISEVEGDSHLTRYRATIIIQARYTKQKAIDNYSVFNYNVKQN